MSFMVVKCPWCGETYTFGVVGTIMVGSGHYCEVRITCEEKDCGRLARFQVRGDGFRPPMQFVCSDHIDRRGIIGCQPGFAG